MNYSRSNRKKIKILVINVTGRPWWLSGKEPSCNARDTGSIPAWGRFHGKGNGNPLQCFCLGNLMDRAMRVTKSWTGLSN